MRIELNGEPADVTDPTVFSLLARIKPGGYATVDGFSVSEDVPLREGMYVCLFYKDEVPSASELDALLAARDTPGVRDKLRSAKVGIAGLGGLGSNVAVMLARAGVGHLVIVDDDTVDATNLNRQDYEMADIGRYKADALKDRISRVNPNVDVESNTSRVDADNAQSLFSGCGIVVEAFDGAESKAMLINTLLAYPGFRVVSGNGVAGFGPANEIITTEPLDRLVMCGDSRTEAGPGCGLTAAHVMIAAAHQANAVIRMILGLPVL